MIVQIPFDVPPEIWARLLTGDLILHGGVVRNPAGRIVAHLKESFDPRRSEEAVAAAARMLRKPTRPVVIAGLAALAVVGTATAAVVIARRREHALPECVQNCDGSLRAYLDAVRDQCLDADVLDRLITDLRAVKAYYENGDVPVSFSAERCGPLADIVLDYTRRLAEANSFSLDESPSSPLTSTNAPVVDLQRYLEVQRRILKDAVCTRRP